MLIVIRNHKWKPKSLLTMIRMIHDAREWDVNNLDIFHIFVVSLRFLLQWRICQQVFHTDPHVIYAME
jgi:hypothetical protein